MTSPEDAGSNAEAEHYDVLIVGAGHGGAQAAIALRQAKYEGSIALLGDEPDPPYERPPLSKEYLSGEKPFERLLIRPASFWPEREIALLPGRRVVEVEPGAHRVRCDDGSTLHYRHLVWATGGAPRRLVWSGHDLHGVHALRTRADADRMRAEIEATRTAVVIGGGYIGLEAAAVLAKAGKKVILFEALDRVLARVAGVRLADGEVLPCEMVIVGIGILPAVEPLLAAGAEGGNGVAVDAQCRTSLADIFAIGDCALHANRFAGGTKLRIESVQNASDQANVVAKILTGGEASYDAVPWFWSNQYDLRLQTVGLSIGHDQAILRGEPASRSFSIVYLKAGRVIALDCVNATRDYVQGRRLVVEGLAIDPARLADTSVPLKEMN